MKVLALKLAHLLIWTEALLTPAGHSLYWLPPATEPERLSIVVADTTRRSPEEVGIKWEDGLDAREGGEQA